MVIADLLVLVVQAKVEENDQGDIIRRQEFHKMIILNSNPNHPTSPLSTVPASQLPSFIIDLIFIKHLAMAEL